MKRKVYIGAIILLLGVAVLLFLQLDTQKNNNQYIVDVSDMYKVDPIDNMNRTALTPKEQDWLIHMREEEKLARDVYTTLGNMWGARVFSNITASEETHTNSVKVLVDRYQISDPVKSDTIGIFTIPEMQKLYDSLVAQGSASLLNAYIVGATIEDLDINDLDTAMRECDQSDIDTVYRNLQKGSRNHMRAFVKNITQQGGEYVPQYISVDDYASIISSPQEKGRVR